MLRLNLNMRLVLLLFVGYACQGQKQEKIMPSMYVFNTANDAPMYNVVTEYKPPDFAQCSAPETSITNTCPGFDCSEEGQTCNNATNNKSYCCVNKKWVNGKCSGPCKRYSSLIDATDPQDLSDGTYNQVSLRSKIWGLSYNQVSLRSKISAQSNSSAYQSVYIKLCAANTVGRTLPEYQNDEQFCVPNTTMNLNDYYINPGCLTGKEEICTTGTCRYQDFQCNTVLNYGSFMSTCQCANNYFARKDLLPELVKKYQNRVFEEDENNEYFPNYTDQYTVNAYFTSCIAGPIINNADAVCTKDIEGAIAPKNLTAKRPQNLCCANGTWTEDFSYCNHISCMLCPNRPQNSNNCTGFECTLKGQLCMPPTPGAGLKQVWCCNGTNWIPNTESLSARNTCDNPDNPFQALGTPEDVNTLLACKYTSDTYANYISGWTDSTLSAAPAAHESVKITAPETPSSTWAALGLGSAALLAV